MILQELPADLETEAVLTTGADLMVPAASAEDPAENPDLSTEGPEECTAMTAPSVIESGGKAEIVVLFFK